jgi:polysaccharide export outer membrane protein
MEVIGLAADKTPPLDGETLGAGDQITIRTTIKEIGEKPFRIEASGDINLPLAGRVHLAGLDVQQAEAAIVKAVSRYYVNPDIAVTVLEFHSEPVSVIGAVGNPGVYEARGHKTLVDILSLAGGVKPDAGPVLTITRQDQYGPLPLPGARQTLSHTTVADVDVKSLLSAREPADNIFVQPFDSISIPRAEMVYVLGNVKKAGGISLGGRNSISVLESVALAEGLDPKAAPAHARILRMSGGSVDAGRQAIPVDINKILKGKTGDVILHPNDILFIPNNTAKSVAARTAEAALQVAIGVLIFR